MPPATSVNGRSLSPDIGSQTQAPCTRSFDPLIRFHLLVHPACRRVFRSFHQQIDQRKLVRDTRYRKASNPRWLFFAGKCNVDPLARQERLDFVSLQSHATDCRRSHLLRGNSCSDKARSYYPRHALFELKTGVSSP